MKPILRFVLGMSLDRFEGRDAESIEEGALRLGAERVCWSFFQLLDRTGSSIMDGAAPIWPATQIASWFAM